MKNISLFVCLAIIAIAIAGCAKNTAPKHVRQQMHTIQWGYIDNIGKIAVKAQFDEVTPFHEGIAAVRIGKKWGFINKQGHFIIKPTFLAPSRFSKGVAFVIVRWTSHDTEYDHSGDWNEMICIDKAGKHLFALRAICFDFSNGLAAFGTGFNSMDGQPNKWGYINKAGKVVIKPTLKEAASFSEGLASVVPSGGSKCGYIDTSGRLVIQPLSDSLGDFHEGLAAITMKGKSGYISKYGKLVIPPRYDDGGDFHCQRAWVLHKDKYGYIDPRGVMRIKPKFDETNDFSEGLAKFTQARTLKVGYIDIDGNIKIKPQFDDALNFHEGLALARIGDMWGYIDKKGKWVIVRPPSSQAYMLYDDSAEQEWGFSEGRAPFLQAQ